MQRVRYGVGAMLLCATILSAGAVPVSAAVLHLRSALIAQSEAPSGFSRAHVHIASHFQPQLTVSIRAGQSQLNASCIQDSSFQSLGWTQGLIEAFDHTSALAALQVCATLFRTPAGAASAYRFLVKRDVKTLIKLKTATPLSMAQIGNQSAGMVRQIKECSCSTTALLRTYDIVYRHDNAVVEATYTGPARFAPDQFASLVAGQNSNLR